MKEHLPKKHIIATGLSVLSLLILSALSEQRVTPLEVDNTPTKVVRLVTPHEPLKIKELKGVIFSTGTAKAWTKERKK